jgi:hypothetical protein
MGVLTGKARLASALWVLGALGVLTLQQTAAAQAQVTPVAAAPAAAGRGIGVVTRTRGRYRGRRQKQGPVAQVRLLVRLHELAQRGRG